MLLIYLKCFNKSFIILFKNKLYFIEVQSYLWCSLLFSILLYIFIVILVEQENIFSKIIIKTSLFFLQIECLLRSTIQQNDKNVYFLKSLIKTKFWWINKLFLIHQNAVLVTLITCIAIVKT